MSDFDPVEQDDVVADSAKSPDEGSYEERDPEADVAPPDPETDQASPDH